jgi:hypothetical protein
MVARDGIEPPTPAFSGPDSLIAAIGPEVFTGLCSCRLSGDNMCLISLISRTACATENEPTRGFLKVSMNQLPAKADLSRHRSIVLTLWGALSAFLLGGCICWARSLSHTRSRALVLVQEGLVCQGVASLLRARKGGIRLIPHRSALWPRC